MERSKNLHHWEELAGRWGTALSATTKCHSLKRLEIEAIVGGLKKWVSKEDPVVVEIGCGNGVNGIMLCAVNPRIRYIGLDFSPRMIEAAVAAAQGEDDLVKERLAFWVADARDLTSPLRFPSDAKNSFRGRSFVGEEVHPDAVFTDRMLINLSSVEEQIKVMRSIASLLKKQVPYLMLEASIQTHALVNDSREMLGLPRRSIAEYNIFIDESRVISAGEEFMDLREVDDVTALHDLILYSVQAASRDGEIQYDSELMTALTEFLVMSRRKGNRIVGYPGQNRLWIWTRKG